jgi:hypothetical protein
MYKAPLPVVIPFSWSGFYVGGHAGGHWGSDEISTVTDPAGFGPAGAAAIDAFSTALHQHGFIGGGQIGYNWSGSGGVLGIEIDASWLGGTASRTLTGIPVINPLDALSNSTRASFLSTYRLRWGAGFEHALFFVTAGMAVGTLKTTDTMAQVGLPAASTPTRPPRWAWRWAGHRLCLQRQLVGRVWNIFTSNAAIQHDHSGDPEISTTSRSLTNTATTSPPCPELPARGIWP